MMFGKKRKASSSGMTTGILSRLLRKKDTAIRKTVQDAELANEKVDQGFSIVAAEEDAKPEMIEAVADAKAAAEVETDVEAEEDFKPEKTEEVEDGVGESSPVDSRYDVNGFDCAGFSQQYYRTAVDSLLNRVCKAGKQMQAGNYEYAVFGAKTAAESAAKMLLCHNGLTAGRMEEDIDDCRRYGLITDEMAGRLHGVRLLGNFNGHSFYAPENLTHGQAYFAIMQTLEFISVIEVQLLWPEPLPELSAEWERDPLDIEEVLAVDNEEEIQ